MVSNKLIKSRGQCNLKSKTYFSFAFHLKGKVIPYANMNTNTHYVYYIRHKQASVNKLISK